ncbi:V-type ATP synthase subunit C [Atopococcus tabaci]|uniref:V-type ATP synthase subunit C n=1 Tax=Atopococcus tabaci TaxID=269774 RepID=UPI0024092ECA|nr:V-type ATP synthase subunit C [Atopococcus tabaci]
MEDTAYASANVRIRVFETNLLTRSHYERMIDAPSYDEAVNVLRDTPYRNIVDDLKETKNYDKYLMQQLHETFEEVYQSTPQRELVDIAALRYSYHNLKVLLKERFTGEDFSSLYIPVGPRVSELRQAIHTKESAELHPAFLESIEEAMTDYEEYQNIQAINIILDRRYFTHMKQLADEMGNEDVKKIVGFYIDLNNLSTLTRAIKQKRTRNFLVTILSSSGTIPKEELVELGRENLVTAGKVLREGKYRSIIEESIDQETQELSPVKIDLSTDDAFMRRMQDAKLQVFGPLPILAFLYSKENEVKNIRLVLAGKENRLPAEKIRERLRMSYDA